MKKYLLVVVMLLSCSIMGCTDGIVILDGYAHGVALCENRYSVIVHKEEASYFADGVASYVINHGHINDPQVDDLIKKAHKVCSNL